jgi:hypothetical protein
MEQTEIQALEEQSLRPQLVFGGTTPSRERDDLSAFGHQVWHSGPHQFLTCLPFAFGDRILLERLSLFFIVQALVE